MTERNKQTKVARFDTAALLDALCERSACGVLLVNPPDQVAVCSPEADRLLHGSVGQGAARRQRRLPATLIKLVREAVATGNAVTGRTIKLPGSGSRAVSLRVTALPLPSKTHRSAVAVVLDDLSVGGRVEENLRWLNRLASLGTLSAGLAHEVKNALVPVKTFVDLLLEKNRDAELADVVVRELRRIDAIVGQMLRQASPVRTDFADVRLHDVLDHSLQLVQPRLQGRMISLHRAFNAAPDAIQGDDGQLEQAFVNLLLNAIEAMGPNGSLTVATDLVSAALARRKAASASGAHVRVAIADTGAGIAPENAHRLFEPFFTTKQQGTGLGLVIARRIVREHQGDITVQTEVNKGTTFNVLLPVRKR